MTRRRRTTAPVLLTLLALLVVPSAIGGAAVVSATGVLTGPAGDGYLTLTIRNTGDEAIRCFRLVVPTTIKVVSARSIPDWQLGASTPPPAPDIGGRATGAGLAPGGTLTLEFRTDPQYPMNAGGTLRVSANCVSDVAVPVTGPAPPPPPPPPKRCKCTKVSVKLDPTLLTRRVPPDRQDFGVGFTWTMTCDAGAGGCRGRVDFLPPEIRAGSLPKPRGNLRLNIRRASINCVGQCNRTQPGRFEVKMRSRGQLSQLFGRTLAFRVRLFCIVNGAPVPKGTVTVRVRIDQRGRMST